MQMYPPPVPSPSKLYSPPPLNSRLDSGQDETTAGPSLGRSYVSDRLAHGTFSPIDHKEKKTRADKVFANRCNA